METPKVNRAVAMRQFASSFASKADCNANLFLTPGNDLSPFNAADVTDSIYEELQLPSDGSGKREFEILDQIKLDLRTALQAQRIAIGEQDTGHPDGGGTIKATDVDILAERLFCAAIGRMKNVAASPDGIADDSTADIGERAMKKFTKLFPQQ
jgi:hypothetical protein